MIPNKEGWHYIAAKELSPFLRGITLKRNDNSWCLNCLHSFTTKNKLEFFIKICENNMWVLVYHVKLKYKEKAKLCYMDTDSFIVSIKTEGIYAVIAKDAEARFDTSNN